MFFRSQSMILEYQSLMMHKPYLCELWLPQTSLIILFKIYMWDSLNNFPSFFSIHSLSHTQENSIFVAPSSTLTIYFCCSSKYTVWICKITSHNFKREKFFLVYIKISLPKQKIITKYPPATVTHTCMLHARYLNMVWIVHSSCINGIK